MTGASLAELLATHPDVVRRVIRRLPPDVAEAVLADWRMWARPSQLPPPEWADGSRPIWLLRAGRGFGKTRTGAELIHASAMGRPPGVRLTTGRIALIGTKLDHVRRVMVEGESGILRCGPRWERPEWRPGLRLLRWPTGAIAEIHSADRPDALRGPQWELIWCDEPAAWPRGHEVWPIIEMGLRLGPTPRALLTGTPKRLRWLIDLADRPDVIVTGGTTWENASHLPPDMLRRLRERYGGTLLGRQELEGEIVDDVEGALWSWQTLADVRGTPPPADQLAEIVVAVDPAVTDTGDETGIIVAGREGRPHDGVVWILEDTSGRMTVDQWASIVTETARRWQADAIIAEANQGGDMVAAVLRSAPAPIRLVHASRGKHTRADPVAALYQADPPRVRHTPGLDRLEEQQATWVPGDDHSPDRVDALVWAVWHLHRLGEPQRRRVRLII